MNLFQLGDFTLNSGAKSRWKLECDALSDKDIECLALMIKQLVGQFSSVEGVPRGGLRLAAALEPHRDLAGPHLIVDDVLTTGGSMERALLKHEKSKRIGAVIFARGQCPLWVKAVFQMPEGFWLEKRTRSAT